MKVLLLTVLNLFLMPSCKAQTTPHIEVGDTIPLFTLPDQNGDLFHISDYIGKKILVIYFYPKDESLVCTKEACAFRDRYTDFTNAGAMVIGINSGSIESHKLFIEHHGLPFTLLSDANNLVLKQFGVKDKLSIPGRETFIIDLSGKVVYYFDAFVQGSKHVEKAIEYIHNMK